MLFSNLLFIYIFLPLLFILYYPFKKQIWRNAVLTVFSMFFYAWGEPVLVLLMLGIITVNYVFGLIISRCIAADKKASAKAALALSVVANLAALIYFKYAGFFVSSINLIPGLSFDVPEILLPLGISFFTFQAMSYTIDVYRSDAPVQKNFFYLLLYVSLFPQLIAGPIVRYRDVCAEIEDRTVSVHKMNEGIFRFSVGLAKKVLLANPCGQVSDSLLATPIADATVSGSWLGALFFAMQIYYDFSGYSDMAIGMGKMLGFEFKENFNYPYISRSATEFWRRWHISLGTFFRDYLYIPLGGSRCSSLKWLRNVLVVWFLTGMWHGASWNFIIWGLFYALLLILEKLVFMPIGEKMNKGISAFVSYVYMIFVTLVGWTIFYYTEDLLPRLKVMFGIGSSIGDIYEMSILRSNLFLLVVAVIFCTPIIPKLLCKITSKMGENSSYAIGRIFKTVFAVVAIALSTAMLAGNSYNPFLYFRF